MKPIRLLLMALVLAALAATPLRADEEEVDPRTYPVATPGLIAEWTKALHANEYYRAAWELRVSDEPIDREAAADRRNWREPLRALAEELATLPGVRVDFETVPLLERASDDEYVNPATPRTVYQLEFHEIPSSQSGVELPVLRVSHQPEDEEGDLRVEFHRLTPAQLSTLWIRYIEDITILSSVERTVTRSTVSNKPLTEVIAGLCELGGVEFAIDARAARGVDVTLDLHNRTIRECLEVATMVVGWRIRYVVDDQEDKTPPGSEVGLGDLAREWNQQIEAARVSGGSEPGLQSVMKALVLDAVRWIRAQKLLVLIEPADRAPVNR